MDQAGPGRVQGPGAPRHPRRRGRHLGGRGKRRARAGRRRRGHRHPREEGPLLRGTLRVGAGAGPPRVVRSHCSHRAARRDGDLGRDHLPRGGRPRRPIARRARRRPRAPNAVPGDLQRRQRRATGRLEGPFAAHGHPARMGRRRLRAGGAAGRRSRPPWREPHLGSAGPRGTRPRQPLLGPRSGRCAASSRCRCTSTSGRASPR